MGYIENMIDMVAKARAGSNQLHAQQGPPGVIPRE